MCMYIQNTGGPSIQGISCNANQKLDYNNADSGQFLVEKFLVSGHLADFSDKLPL